MTLFTVNERDLKQGVGEDEKDRRGRGYLEEIGQEGGGVVERVLSYEEEIG